MASSAAGGIAKRWRELQGEHSWDGLLDPLDIDLRKSIINYGELTQATYDSFNTEQRSPHAGACMYGYGDLLEKSGAAAAGQYKHAVAGQYIVVAWRGTIRPLEWSRDFDVAATSAAPVLGAAASTNPLAMVHNGFLQGRS
ncbi:hypothetical protein EJB05_16216, partial [Eragrostis curvula]